MTTPTYTVYNASYDSGAGTVDLTDTTAVASGQVVTDTTIGTDGRLLGDNATASVITIPGVAGGADLTYIGVFQDGGGNDGFLVTDGTNVYAVFASNKLPAPGPSDTGNNVFTASSSDPTTQWGLVKGDIGCFVIGTMIATPAGDVAVEALKAGDLVLTQSGTAVPVRWLGETRVSRLFGDASRILPVRIKAGALGENLPVRDLCVSPNHAIAIDGLLIQAGALVNGTTIVRDTAAPASFTYYHVELDNHDLLVAEGAAAESYLDVVEDMTFANVAARPARTEAMHELPMARVKAARQVPQAITSAIAARAAAVLGDMAAAA